MLPDTAKREAIGKHQKAQKKGNSGSVTKRPTTRHTEELPKRLLEGGAPEASTTRGSSTYHIPPKFGMLPPALYKPAKCNFQTNYKYPAISIS
jgi:hypothetical protein